jgi:hypothetical protein
VGSMQRALEARLLLWQLLLPQPSMGRQASLAAAELLPAGAKATDMQP